ncbi:hypothetical protein CDL15_Pgr022171 [Punica granatum]|uniref:Uncharacterized protein n=1 Tax=Punica granatum TaxID=22663 RepID=A0A218VSU0_PUNGR|nr:hypothetical protein CDL15_Pgr022171 [Punica granatum]
MPVQPGNHEAPIKKNGKTERRERAVRAAASRRLPTPRRFPAVRWRKDRGEEPRENPDRGCVNELRADFFREKMSEPRTKRASKPRADSAVRLRIFFGRIRELRASPSERVWELRESEVREGVRTEMSPKNRAGEPSVF